MYGLTGFVSSPLNSYVTAERGRLQPARAMTFMSAAYNFGAVIGPLTGGWVGDRVGLRLVYFIAAGLFVISTSFVFFLRAQPREPHDPDAPVPGLLRNSRFVGFLGVVFLVMFVTYLPQPLTARFLEQERSLSLGNIGILGSMNGLGNAVFNLLLGQFRPQVGMLLVQVCVAAFTLAIWQGTGLGWYMTGYFLLGGHRTVRSFFFSTVRALIHPAQMGLAYGISETFNSSAMVLAPLLAGFVYTRDPAAVYPLSLGLIILATLVVIAFMPRKAGELTPRVEPTLEP
jgi:MFS transporter, DHA1 family, multidrug resistance protein